MSDALELIDVLTADERALGSHPVHPGLYLIVACVAIAVLWTAALVIRAAWSYWEARKARRRALEAIEAPQEGDDAWPMKDPT